MAEKSKVPDADAERPVEDPSRGEADARRAAQDRETRRAATRQGPSHPAHWQHPQWLDERGLDEKWDQR